MTSLENSKPHFRVSPEVLGPLGIEQLQDPALAVLELIKNSWDADAKRVKIAVDQRISPGKILVNDDGHGMSEGEFKKRWLVIGASFKRDEHESEGGRPLIGEKGLGRLASFALGNTISVRSARKTGKGFVARVDWKQLSSSSSLEEYEVNIDNVVTSKGMKVAIRELKAPWSENHTEFLVSHAEFLASVPGQKFRISLRVDGKPYPIEDASATIDRLAEGFFEMKVGPSGKPKVTSCIVNGVDETGIVFRDMKHEELDSRLNGIRLSFKFFRRDGAARRLGGTLERNEVSDVLERYQGIRIYRDGINVPPYGLNRDDWAGLEKQRTATGGPTLVPGNSQLIGELHVSKRAQPYLVITAGRSGFADQSAVQSLAKYVRWSVRAFGTARRAEQLGITGSDVRVPSRVDLGKESPKQSPARVIRRALAAVARAKPVQANPALRRQVEDVARTVTETLGQNEETLRLYAQLASTGIAATSFSHELRGDFDVVSEAVSEIRTSRTRLDRELIELLSASWARIRSFAGLFKVLPVKTRRTRKALSSAELQSAAGAILKLVPPDKVKTHLSVTPGINVSVVPAEVDSILLNLVSNAVKAVAASPNRESGRIDVRYEARGTDLAIHVADNGCGVSPRVREIMFEPLEGKFSEGTGMGLPIVKYIAERYKGGVTVRSNARAGFVTEFVVTMRDIVR